jgi:coenzyme F420-reducing hydrogenase alpha subunit
VHATLAITGRESCSIKEANLIVGTTNNNAAISMSIEKVAEGLRVRTAWAGAGSR